MSTIAQLALFRPPEAPGQQRVLVAVLPSPADLRRVVQEGWYRIPVARAPQQMAADYLAFYQTGAFEMNERWQVAVISAVRRVGVAQRRELLPAEPHHPRAEELYYRIELEQLQRLARPVVSRRLRRITFISTTLARLLNAREINDLWDKGPAQDRLWQALLAAGLEAERQAPWDEAAEDEDEISLDELRGVAESPERPLIDFALTGAAGRVAVICLTESEEAPRRVRELPIARYALVAAGWIPIVLETECIWRQPNACLQEINAALLGDSARNSAGLEIDRNPGTITLDL